MNCILTGVTILVYVVWCVSVFVLFPSHSKKMTVKSDFKISAENIKRGVGVLS